MQAYASRVVDFLRPLMTALRSNHWLRLAANLFVFGFCAAYLATHFQNILGEVRQVEWDYRPLILALLLAPAVVWLGAVAWWLLLLGFGQSVPWWGSARAHLKSSIAKYIPGYAWQYLSKAYLTSGIGVPVRLVSLLLVWEFLQFVWTALVVSLLTFPSFLRQAWGWPAWSGPLTLLAGCVLGIAGLLFPVLLHRGFLRGVFGRYAVQPGLITLSALVDMLGWFLLGLSTWWTAAAFHSMRLTDLLSFVFSFAVSMEAGILVILVPNGLGVREGVMSYLLGHLLPLPVVLLVATVSRLEIIIGEFVAVLLMEVIYQLRMRSGQRISPPGSKENNNHNHKVQQNKRSS